jgi:hypothetical protein
MNLENNMKVTDDLLRFRAEFSDVKSLADVPRLSRDRLARFKQQLNLIEDCGIVAAEAG